MSQTGLHALVGAGVSRLLIRSRSGDLTRTAAGPVTFGVIVGTMAPDLDFLAVVASFPFSSHVAHTIHRTFSHSILVIAAVTMVGLIVSKTAAGRLLMLGLGAGMCLHVLLDIFMWFEGLDILWPLGVLDVPSRIDLWKHYSPGLVQLQLLGASEYGFFALFLHYLRSVACRHRTDLDYLPVLTPIISGLVAAWVVYSVLAFLLPRSAFEIAHYGLFALAALPVAFYSALRLRDTIQAEATAKPAAAARKGISPPVQ